jgi:hypothetical protein
MISWNLVRVLVRVLQVNDGLIHFSVVSTFLFSSEADHCLHHTKLQQRFLFGFGMVVGFFLYIIKRIRW